MKIAHRFLLVLLAHFLPALPALAQSHPRTAVTVWDSGWKEVKGGSGNKQKISLRIWQEQVQHSDGSYFWSLNYEVEARNRNFVGNWSWASQLSHLTYNFTGPSGTHSGTVSLSTLSVSKGRLFDGATCLGQLSPPIIDNATVTAVRTGGPVESRSPARTSRVFRPRESTATRGAGSGARARF